MPDLSFNPLISGLLWLALAAAAIVLLVVYAMCRPLALSRRRWSGIVTLMAVATAVVLILLLNPTWSRQLPPPPGKPLLTILLDTSGSMSTSDAGGTRFIAAAKVAQALESGLSDTFDVRIRAFDQTLRRLDPGSIANTVPDGAGTDIATAVNASLTEERAPGEAVVLLSDGIDNTGGGTAPVLAAVRTARAMAAPIYTQTFGGNARQIDLAVDIRSPQDMAVVNQNVPLTAHVTAMGLANVKTNVTLLHDGRELARREVLVGDNTDANVTFQVSQPKVGMYSYEVRVDPVPGEISQENNSAEYVLRVVDEPIRVLVIDGKPYWDSKFFTRTLMDDPAVALDCIVRLSDTRLLHRTLTHQRPAATAPSSGAPSAEDSTAISDRVETWKIDHNAASELASPDRLRGYQIIVIGRDAEPFLTPTAVENLQNWVSRQGGSLLCYRGSPTSDQRLARLLPVKWSAASPSRFRVVLTTAGEDLNWFALGSDSNGTSALPYLPSLAADDVIESQKPLAVVLAKTVGGDGDMSSPAVIYQQYGSGRVVVVEGSGMWRWAFLAPQYQSQEQVYATLWHSMLRWLTSAQQLSPGQSFSLRADKIRFDTNEAAAATLLARRDADRQRLPTVELSRQGSAKPLRSFAPVPIGSEAGVYRINFGSLPEGRYIAALAGLAGKSDDPASQIMFDVRPYNQEMMDLTPRPDLMARIALDSGGAVLDGSGDPTQRIETAFAEHQANVQPPQMVRSSAWDRWWLLAAVLGCWTLSWFVRRSSGLV